MPVYLRLDQGLAGEPCLLGTNVVLPPGLMVPGPGVCAKRGEAGTGGIVTVRLIPIDAPCPTLPKTSGSTTIRSISDPDPSNKLSTNTVVSL